MITDARNKQATQRTLTARDTYIIAKARAGFGANEILVLMDRDGFKPPARSRIYQILEANGVSITK